MIGQHRRVVIVATLALAAVTGIAGCSAPAQQTPPTSQTAAPPTPTATSTPTAPEETPVPTETTITITFGGTTVRGILPNSPAADSLIAQLPLELSFSDFGGQEKLATLPSPVTLDGMPSGGGATPGTIGYYAPDQVLVLYYDTVGYYEGIIPLGTFDNVDLVRDSAAFIATLAL